LGLFTFRAKLTSLRFSRASVSTAGLSMATSAKVLAPGELRRVQARASRGRFAHRNKVIIMLSFKAGLRACEIAGLTWAMVLAADGRIGSSLAIDGLIAKNGRARRVPMHPELKRALQNLHKVCGHPVGGPVVRSQRGSHMTPRSVVNWFSELYERVGLAGCSSHSGRRTFITLTARMLGRAGGSLRDVQELAGHRSITTTERYIEGDRDAQRKLVAML
jgi:integrase/recombinase XerD